MAKNSQYMNYEGVEAEKQTILAEMNNIIEIIQNAHNKVLAIASEEIWIGKKSDQFFEDLKKLWATGLDGVGYVTTLENDRDNMVKFIDAAIMQTAKEDAEQSFEKVVPLVLSAFGVNSDKAENFVGAMINNRTELSDDWVSPYRLYNYATHDPGQKNQRAVYSYLINDMGLSEAGAAAVMANMAHEMYFDTDWEIKDTNGKVSGGLCAWNAGRYTNLQNYCKKKNLDYKSVEGQMSYLEYELSTEPKYKEVYSALKTAKTEEDARAAARLFCIKFEVPTDKYNKGNARGDSAVKLLNSFK